MESSKDLLENSPDKRRSASSPNRPQSREVAISSQIKVGNKTVVVGTEEISGESDNVQFCTMGSPAHIIALKTKMKELGAMSQQIEEERKKALERENEVLSEMEKYKQELGLLKSNV